MRREGERTAWAVAIFALLATMPAWAQEMGGGADDPKPRRSGFWIGFGGGAGWNTSEGLDDDRRAGGALYLRMGGSPSQKLLIGGEIIGWGRELNEATVARGNATVSALFYPSRRGGLFLKGGLGGSSLEIKRDGDNETENGFGSTLGVGWDIRLSRSLSLTPNADFLFQAFDAGENLQSTNTLFLLTLGLTFH